MEGKMRRTLPHPNKSLWTLSFLAAGFRSGTWLSPWMGVLRCQRLDKPGGQKEEKEG